MTHQTYEWVSVAEAARRLDVSPSTVRRMIEEGKLIGERQVIGGSRERFLVRFDAPDEVGEASDMQQAPPAVLSHDEASTTPRSPPALTERSLDIFSAIFKGNLQLIQEKDAALMRQAEQIADLRERAGRAEASAAAHQARADDLAARLAAAEARAAEAERRKWWRRILG